MTRDADRKRLIRAHMAATGARYAAAREQLLARPAPGSHQQPSPPSVLDASPEPLPAGETNSTTDTSPNDTSRFLADLAFYEKTVRTFFDGERLRSIPARRKPRVVILLELLQRFEPGRRYSEIAVNRILRSAHDDVAFLRRELVDYRYLSRADGQYWVTDDTLERDPQEAQEVPADEQARIPRR